MSARWTESDLARAMYTRGAIAATAAPKPSKYGNLKTNGYASRREAKRAEELKLMEAAGEISNLREQVPIELIPAQYVDGKCVERACKYVSDFAYVENGQEVYEDSKGFREPVYRIKRKVALFLKGIRIKET